MIRGLSGGRLIIPVLILLTLVPETHAGIRHEGVATSVEDQVRAEKSVEPEALLRELESFNTAPVSLRDALAIVQERRVGARVVDASFDGTSDSPVYRVQTNRDDHIWQDAIDARTGAAVGPGLELSVADVGKPEKRLLVRLNAVRQNIIDAVVVAERNTSGKAISAGLKMDRGRFQFVITCIAGNGLKQVLLEPPRATRPQKR